MASLLDASQGLHMAQFLAQQGKYAEALRLIEKLRQKHPKRLELLELLCEYLIKSDRLELARQALDWSLQQHPSAYKLWLLLGQLCLKHGQNRQAPLAENKAYIQQAQDSFGKGLEIEPENAEAWFWLAETQFFQESFEEALLSFEQANQLKPSQAGILAKLGHVSFKSFKMEQAIAYYQQALELAPLQTSLWSNLGNIYSHLDKTEDAKRCYKEALKLSPINDYAKFSQRMLELKGGESLNGWLYFRMIREGSLDPLPENCAEWDGVIRSNKPLAIVGNMGIGDMLNMLCLVTKLRNMGQPCVLWTHKHSGFKRLCESMQPPLEVFEGSAKNPAVEHGASHYIHEIDLGLFFKWRRKFAEPQQPYLFVRPEPEHYLDTKGLKVGFVWASATCHILQGQDHYWSYRQRSTAFEEWIPLFETHPEVNFYSLQVGRMTEVLNQYPELPVVDLSPHIRDLYDTACFIEQMDLVISVDTSVAHLVGGMGKPLWLLLPLACDWRWGYQEESSPWYPSARLFRQQTLLDWKPVIAAISQQLTIWKTSSSRQDPYVC